jgi:hypothetical protein
VCAEAAYKFPAHAVRLAVLSGVDLGIYYSSLSFDRS